MSAGTWRVRKIGAGNFPWEVDEWDTTIGDWSNRDVCETLPEAHTYAMRQSRIITVELPKVGNRKIFRYGSWDTEITQDFSGDVWIEWEDHTVVIFPDQLEKIALTLLAMHHQRRAQQ